MTLHGLMLAILAQAPVPAGPAADPLTLLASTLDVSRPVAERVASLRSLSAAGDARLRPVLVYLARDAEREVRGAAVTALAQGTDEDAERRLVQVIEDSAVPATTREDALRALRGSTLPSPTTRLAELAESPKLPRSLRQLARAELEMLQPPPPGQLPPGRSYALTRRGQGILTSAGIVFGGYSLWVVGNLGQAAGGASLGLLGGAALGGTAGYLLGREMAPYHALTLSMATGWGAWTGISLGLLALGPGSSRFVHLFGLGGQLAGAAAGHFTWKLLDEELGKRPLEVDPAVTVTGVLLGVPLVHLASQIRDTGDTALQALAIGSGAVLGSGTANILGRKVFGPRASYLAVNTGWGLGLGALTAHAFVGAPSFSTVELAAIAGAGVGLGSGIFTWSDGLTRGDIAVLNATALFGASLGLGFTNLWPQGESTRDAGVVAGATTVSLVAARLATPHLQFKRKDVTLVAFGAGQGALTGLLVHDAFGGQPSGRQRAAGLFIGAPLGALVAAAATQLTDVPEAATEMLVLGDVLGSVTGLGAALVGQRLPPRGGAISRAALLGGYAGIAAASTLHERMKLTKGDRSLIAAGTVIGAWNGVGISAGLQASATSTGGATLLGAGLGGTAALALSRFIEPSTTAVLAAGSGALWGTWLSTSALFLSGSSSSRSLLAVVGASDAGLIATAVLLSPWVGARPFHIGVASVGGLGGATLFSLARALFPADARTLVWANVIGGCVGLAAGGFFASRLSLDTAAQQAEAAESSRSPWPKVRLIGVSGAPLMGPDGKVRGAGLRLTFSTS